MQQQRIHSTGLSPRIRSVPCLAQPQGAEHGVQALKTSDKDLVNVLFTPFQLGQWKLENRMVFPPLTRMRATLEHLPQPHMEEYYAHRATKGSLFISEAAWISPQSCWYARVPGIYTDEQAHAWKPIVRAVKDRGALFFCQLLHCGRASHPVHRPHGQSPVGPSAIAIGPDFKCPSPEFKALPYPVPEALTVDGMKTIVKHFKYAARRALDAGFDGVEIHSANGYLLEQFIKSSSNHRTDAYGGSIDKRCRFPLEVTDAIAAEIGPERLGVRLSPFSVFQDAVDGTPYASYMYMVEQLNKRKLVYLHMIEARVQGGGGTDSDQHKGTLEPFRAVWDGPFIAAGGYNAEKGAHAIASGDADLVAFGRAWIANPDLPKRIKLGAPLNPYDRATFYSNGMNGYLDYPTLEQLQTTAAAAGR